MSESLRVEGAGLGGSTGRRQRVYGRSGSRAVGDDSAGDGQGRRPAFAGVAMGTLAALDLANFLRSFLFGVAPSDPLTFAAVRVALLSVGVLASWLPARGAARLELNAALRESSRPEVRPKDLPAGRHGA